MASPTPSPSEVKLVESELLAVIRHLEDVKLARAEQRRVVAQRAVDKTREQIAALKTAIEAHREMAEGHEEEDQP